MEWFKTVFNKAKSVGEVYIYGEISDEKWFDEDVTPTDIKKDVDKLKGAPHVNLYVNSPGGGVFAGMAIHNMLSRLSVGITGYVDGVAASIASVILMVSDKIIVPATGMIMIHDPGGIAIGGAEEMRKTAELLDRVKTTIIAAYVSKTGKTAEKIAALMSDETWMDGKLAVKMGFADEIGTDRHVSALAKDDGVVVNGVKYFPKNFERFPQNWAKPVKGFTDTYRENKLKLLKQQTEVCI